MKTLTRTEFFNLMKKDCHSQKDYLIALLELRGFLLEKRDGIVYLSDNGHKDDAEYLNSLLIKYRLGCVSNNTLVIEGDMDASLFEEEFAENKTVGGEVCIIATDWSWFRHREHGEKVPVEWLEPFIARYVKAISASCVLTAGCCDGNHPGRDKMFLQLSGQGSIPWHRVICKYLLDDRFDIKWINDYTAVKITPDTKYDMYYELNKAAQVIYNNRIKLRTVKDKVLREMKNGYLKRSAPAVIETEFIDKVSVLLKTIKEG